MIFKQVSQQVPSTKQLFINKTQIDITNDRHNIFYDDGIPDRLIFKHVKNSAQSVCAELTPIMVIGRKCSMSDYEVNNDLTDMNGSVLGVSRYHAMLMAFDNHIYIKDLDSLNGMLLNGKRMIPSKEYVFDDGDILAFGSLEVRVQFDYNK